MPLSLSIDQDIIKVAVKGLEKAVTQRQKDAAFALRSTVTRTAAEGRKAINNALKTKLHRPVPFIYKAYFFKPAKDLNNPSAQIFVGGGFGPGSKADYIESITTTGEHITSRVTKRLRVRGVLRHNEHALATRGIKRNSRGNINGGHLQKVLAGKKGVTIKKGKFRGLYEVKGRGRKIRKVYTPGREPRRYTPRVNIDKVLQPIIESFDFRFNQAFQKNVSKSRAKLLR